MRLGCAVLFLACAAQAQNLVDSSRLPPAFRTFDPQPDEKKLDCSVREIKPSLNFSFRFQAGWVLTVPAKQYTGPRHRWMVITRVTPDGGTPVYLASGLRLPGVTQNNARMEVSGSYLLGEGKYRVQLKLVDDSGRVCRARWNAEARLSRSESKVRVALPEGTVADLSRRSPPGGAERDDVAPFRLTVLFHAAPISQRRIPRMSPRDRVTMMGLLSSLLERLPTSSVRMVVFNLEHQAELLRLTEVGPGGLGRVGQALNELELGTVDFQTLVNRKGHVDLLAELINREVSEPEQSDVVLFLGPPARFSDKVPEEALDKPKTAAAGPGFFYFQYRPPFRREAFFGDSIGSAISRLGGRLKVIRTPGDLAKAIGDVEHRAAQSASLKTH